MEAFIQQLEAARRVELGGALRAALFMLVCIFCTQSWAAQDRPGSVAFWYAEDAPLPELGQFDWVVVEPGHLSAADVGFLRARGAEPLAYLSVGEFDGDQAALDQQALGASASPIRNHAWDSQVMDLSAPAWRNHLFSRAAELKSQGYGGLFLDTLDSFNLQSEAARPEQKAALASLLRELHERQPDLKLIFNRGFEVLPELGDIPAAVAVESIHAGWDAAAGEYRPVSDEDRTWLDGQLKPLRAQGIPLIAIDYLPAQQRNEARALAARLHAEGFIPFVGTPELDSLGVSNVEVQPRRIAVLFDPREGPLESSAGHINLGGLLEYLGYRVDYLPVDAPLPDRPAAGLYAGVVVWMTSGPPLDAQSFYAWLGARLDEQVPLAFMGGLPVDNDALLARMGLRRGMGEVPAGLRLVSHDAAILGNFEAPLVARSRGLAPVSLTSGATQAALRVADGQGTEYAPVVLGDWGGMAIAPYVFEEGSAQRRWILDPFTFLERALRLPAQPRPDTTTENGRRIATVHIDGDGFPSRAEMPGTPYSGEIVLDRFIRPYPLLTTVSVIEGEVSPLGMFPHLSAELEPLARRIFADPQVEVATHTFSHPFFWQLEIAQARPDFNPMYGYMMAIPGYQNIDLRREIFGSRDYINRHLTTAQKPVKLVLWSGDALPDATAIGLAYEAGLLNVNGGVTAQTRANPSLTNLYPLLRPTAGGMHFYAPVINENVYTNLWTGPYYGFRDVMDTFALTDGPRRTRGLHLYYHFYSGTKQASIKVMADIYRNMLEQQPLSLWMSDYLTRVRGLHQASLARTSEGMWQIRGMDGLRTVRLDPQLGWPDLARSRGVAGVRDLPQGRYVHLSSAESLLALRPDRDPRPALEEANLPLLEWRYLDERRVEFSFAGQFPLRFSVRSAVPCQVDVQGRRFQPRKEKGLLMFELPMEQVRDAQLLCN